MRFSHEYVLLYMYSKGIEVGYKMSLPCDTIENASDQVATTVQYLQLMIRSLKIHSLRYCGQKKSVGSLYFLFIWGDQCVLGQSELLNLFGFHFSTVSFKGNTLHALVLELTVSSDASHGYIQFIEFFGYAAVSVLSVYRK